MENKNELGHIYGARISKSGKWLNLTIAAEINGEKYFITCPVRMEEDFKHPFAFTELDSEGATHAKICYIPVYEDSKPKQEEQPADDLPF